MAVHSDAKDVAPMVAYEVEMLFESVRWLKDLQNKGQKSTSLWNLLLEAMLVHTRVLYDFFYRDTPIKADDVLAVHFFDNDWEWTQVRRGLFPYLEDKNNGNLDRLNKSLTHLTYARLKWNTELAKQWDITRIASQVRDVWERFLATLPRQHKAWFPNAVQQQRMYVPSTNLRGSTSATTQSSTQIY